MREKRRNGRASTKTSVEDEIALLRGLDLKGHRARWHSVFQRPAPALLPRHLLFAIIAYRIQADRLGGRRFPNAGWSVAAPNSVAGNGIFGCRDRRPKIHPRDPCCRQRPGTLKIGGKIPAETASF